MVMAMPSKISMPHENSSVFHQENHGKRIAVIENEFGDTSIDDALVAKNSKFSSDEEIIEVMNGCICCTVRGDLVETLKKLATKVAKFDGVIIETTGLADPAPVAQTFFVDEEVMAAPAAGPEVSADIKAEAEKK